MGRVRSRFIWYLAQAEQLLSKSFLSCQATPSWYFELKEQAFTGGFSLSALVGFPGLSDFSTTSLGCCRIKGNLGKSPACQYLGLCPRTGLPPSLYLSEPSYAFICDCHQILFKNPYNPYITKKNFQELERDKKFTAWAKLNIKINKKSIKNNYRAILFINILNAK